MTSGGRGVPAVDWRVAVTTASHQERSSSGGMKPSGWRGWGVAFQARRKAASSEVGSSIRPWDAAMRA